MSNTRKLAALAGLGLAVVLTRCALRSTDGGAGEKLSPAPSTEARTSDHSEPFPGGTEGLEREPAAPLLPALEGKVVSRDGKSLAGARVRWLSLQREDVEIASDRPVASWDLPPRTGVETIADQNGRFRFELKPGSERPFGSVLVATHAEHSPGGCDLVSDPRAWPGELVIELPSAPRVAIRVVDDSGTGQGDALVRHVTAGGGRSLYSRFLAQEVKTDGEGRANLTVFEGEQAFWAEQGRRVSLPWQGRDPKTITLRLGESFTVGGRLVLPGNPGDPGAEACRILIAGHAGNLWRPLRSLSDVGPGAWGPISVPLAGLERIRVRLEGSPFVPQEEEFPTPVAGSHRAIDFVAELGAELQLAIQDESGTPIPNARATAWWGVTEATSGKSHVAGTSGPDGRVRLFVRPGALQFRASASGFAFAEGDAVAPVAYPVILTKGGRIVGRCLHQGKPMPDFQVIHWQAGPVVVHRSASFLDREDGSFELEDLPPGGWWLLAASPTHPGSAPVLVEVRPEETARVELDLPLPIRGGGRIIDQATGLPVPEARVQVFAAGANGRSLPWGLPVPVSQDGSFDLDAFVVGPNYLTADADGYASIDVTATATSSDFLDWGDIRLPRPQALRINLLGLESLEGFSPADLRVQAATGLEEKHFDTEGGVVYESVRPGDHEVLIFHPDSSWSRLHLRLDPGSDWIYDFKIAGGRALGVRVLEESGKPLPPEAAVILATQEENGVYVVRLCQPWRDGHVRFEGIRSTRVQIIVLAVDNETLTSRDLDLSSDDQEVEIRLGDAPFRIRVVDGEGAAVPGAWLSIRTSLADEFVGVADTKLDGWASFKGLPPGQLLLNVGHPSMGTRYSVPIEAASKELEFVLEASGSLQLTLADGTEPLPGVATRIETASGVTLADARETGSDGVVRYELLGEGNYRLGCRRADCWPVFVEKTLAPAEHASVTVQMRRLADLELVFVNRDGLAVSDLDVALHSLEFDAPVATWLAEGRVEADGLTTDSSGRIRVERLPRGAYEWSVSFGQQIHSGVLELVPAEPNRARILLP